MEGHGQGLIRMEGIFDLDRPYPIPYSVVYENETKAKAKGNELHRTRKVVVVPGTG